MPTSRDESAFNKTAWPVESRKSLQKTEMDGRNPHRAVRFHSRIGFTSHGRELLHKVQALQYLLTHSFSGKVLAVRRVTENQGKNTPGVDKVTWADPVSKGM